MGSNVDMIPKILFIHVNFVPCIQLNSDTPKSHYLIYFVYIAITVFIFIMVL